MDKLEILKRVRTAVDDINSGRPTFAAAGLHGLENELTHDVAAEAEVRRAVVVNGETVTPTWEMAAKRCRIKCRRLRAERDAAREHIAKQVEINDKLKAEFVAARKNIAKLGAIDNELRQQLAAAREDVRPPSDYSDLVTENARLRNTLRESQEITKTVGDALLAERERRYQLQAERRDPTVDLLAAQFAAHRQELNDELATHAYRLESLENRFAALKAI